MSREHGPIGLAIEWSPRGVVAYDANTHQTRTADDLAGLGLGSREAILALSRRGVFVRTTRVPNASPSEVRTILTMQVGEMFPLPVIDLAWDFLLTDDVNGEGRLAVVAAVPCADLRQALDAAGAAGLRIRAAAPLALGATLLAAELGFPEAAVVECAEDGPAVDVISGGALRASRATPSTVSLAMEVTRALGLAGMDGSTPIVAAGGADLPDAAKKTERNALMALAEAPFDRLKLRLELPEAIAARSTTETRRQIRTAGAAAVAAGLLALLVANDWYDAKSAAEETSSRAAAALRKVKAVTATATTEQKAQEDMKAALDLAFRPAQKPSEVIALATAAVPPGTWLRGLTFERGRPVALRGTAKSTTAIAELVRKLDTNPERRFRNVDPSNASSSLVNKVPVTEFVVSAFPVGNLPILARAKVGR